MRPKIVLFGDSITEYSLVDGGWGAALAHHFSRKVDVVIRGYSGYNTRWALQIIEKIIFICSSSSSSSSSTTGVTKVESNNNYSSNGELAGAGDQSPPLAVTVFFGANDASLPDRSCGFQHVPLHEYKQNLHSIVSFIKKRWPTTLILLITPPPIDEDGRLRYPYGDNPSGLPERTNEAAGAYAKACVAVAEECGVLVVDLWTKMQQFPNWEKYYLSDGLHLTSSGNKIVFEEVVEKLKEAGLSIEKLPADLPLLADIDPREPLKAFQD